MSISSFYPEYLHNMFAAHQNNFKTNSVFFTRKRIFSANLSLFVLKLNIAMRIARTLHIYALSFTFAPLDLLSRDFSVIGNLFSGNFW